jgi:hypothetical protein
MEANMKSVKKTAFVLTLFVLALVLLGAMAISCTTTGEHMPLSNDEVVIGTVQAVFTARSASFFFKTQNSVNAINTQAYIKLLEAAQIKYSGNIDVRDIVWVTAKAVDHEYTEVSASGKVIDAK